MLGWVAGAGSGKGGGAPFDLESMAVFVEAGGGAPFDLESMIVLFRFRSGSFVYKQNGGWSSRGCFPF